MKRRCEFIHHEIQVDQKKYLRESKSQSVSVSMKRQRSTVTLWDAANVHKHQTFWHWWQYIRRNDYPGDARQTVSFGEVEKSVKRQKPDNAAVMSTFSVALRPTKSQKVVLNHMLKVSNQAYNYSNYLVREKQMKLNHFDLNKYVGKSKTVDIPVEFRMPNDEWYFENKMSMIKGTSCKNFCAMYKSARTNQKKSSVTLRDKDIVYLREGSFQVPKKYVRLLKESDTKDLSVLNRCIALMSDNFTTLKKHVKERFLRLAKPVHKLPAFNHDMRISKRANGKFILQIPCDAEYTRRESKEVTDAMCGIDPGGRTFATVFDPTNVNAYQVGLKEDKQFVIHNLFDRIDECHRYLNNAEEKNHEQEKRDRVTQLKKLHLRLKTFVEDIHLKLSQHLVRSYKYVALGKISVSNIVKKDRPGHLSKKANRDLLCWKHYAFRQRLEHRAHGTDCEVVVQEESYTSKTCGVCGVRKKDLGSNETFTCKSCGYETHRDINGARNILLKSLNMFPFN